MQDDKDVDFSKLNAARAVDHAILLAAEQGDVHRVFTRDAEIGTGVKENPFVLLTKFNYTAFTMAELTVGTNAYPNGGDTGHGFHTRIELSVEAGNIDFHIGGDQEGYQHTLTIDAGGCDEAMALMRLLELAAAALRRQLIENKLNAQVAEEDRRRG